MKTTFISTVMLWSSPRAALSKMQADLAKENKQITTGRYADVGLQLGYRAGDGITLRQERNELDALIDSNAVVSQRLSTTRVTLDSVRGTAQEFLAAIVATPSSETIATIVAKGAKDNLSALVAKLNTSAGGQFIFAGTNTKERPLNEYDTSPASAAKSAMEAAFTTQFGFPRTSASVSTIAPADMQSFLDGAFESLFDDASWAANWSSASSQNIESRISTSEKVETSTNTNEPGFRKIAMAYAMASDLATLGLSNETQAVVVNKIVDVISRGVSDLVNTQAKLGVAEKKVADANERMALQKDILAEGVGKLENVDPAEAKSRVDALTAQIQMSYSLTSQLRQLSLINYL